MAVGPIAIPQWQAQPGADFSSLAQLPQVYERAQAKQGLADLGRGLADGTLDYRQAAARAASSGNVDAAMKFLALDEAKQREARGLQASNQFSQSLASLYPGGGGAAMPTPATVAPTTGKIYSSDEPSPLDPPSGKDRDLAIRTVIAEAGNQGPTGMNAVGSVIRNRAVAGSYGGDTPSGVVTSPNQFEPWNDMSGRARMAGIDPNSPKYQAASQALDQAYAGNDPTNGATNFYAPKAQAALGRPAPAWDNGKGVDIGDHRFFGGAQGGQPAPYQVAQAGGAAPQQNAPARPGAIPQAVLYKAMTDPNLPADQKEIAKELWKRSLDEMKPADRIKVLQGLKDNPQLLEIEEKLRSAGKTTVNVGAGEKEEEKAAGKGAGERRATMFAAAGAAPKTLLNLNRTEAILDQVAQGKIEPARMTVSAWAKSLGLDDEVATKLGLDPKGVGSAQALAALTNESVLGKIGPGGLPANNFSNKDLQFLVDIFPKLGDDPASNKIKIEGARRMAHFEVERARDYQAWKKNDANKGKGFEDFELEWSEKIASQDRFGDLRAQAEKISGGGAKSSPAQPEQPPRQASDGQFYVPDPKRPGKYLRVIQ